MQRRATSHRSEERLFSLRAVVYLITACCIPVVLRCSSAFAEPAPADPAPCTLEPGATRTVARVIDAETLGLDDGSELRLIETLPPRARDSGATAGAWPIETSTVRLLTSLVLGRDIKLAYGQRRTDRYGRHLAHVFLGQGSS